MDQGRIAWFHRGFLNPACLRRGFRWTAKCPQTAAATGGPGARRVRRQGSDL